MKLPGIRHVLAWVVVAGVLAAANPVDADPPADYDATFAVFGDYGNNSTTEGEVALLVDSLAPDFLVTTGDNIYLPGTYETNVGAYYGSYIGGAQNRFFPSPGNTDYTDAPNPGIGDYLAYFDLPGAGVATSGTSGNERYYDVIFGSVHIFLIDSDAILADSVEATAEAQWLQTQLAASTTPWQVVVAHHPPFTSRKPQPYWDEQWPFADWGADAVLSGHDHSYERLEADGIPYFISGLGGRPEHGFPYPHPNSQFQYNASHGTMLVSACDIGMRFEFHTLSEGIVDTSIVGSPCEPIAGRVFLDEPGEPGIPNVKVILRSAGSNGVFDGDDVFTNTWTSPDGSYWFPGLTAGPYRVSVKDSTLPAGLALTSGSDPAAITLAPGDHAVVDFGYADPNGPGSVAGVVYLDEAGQPGIGGVKMILRSAGANGVFDGDDVFTSTWTATDGSYGFAGLAAGPYRVSVKDSTLPAGLVLSAGADPTQLSLGAAEHATVDFGYADGSGLGSVFGVVYVDEAGQPGIGGVKMILRGAGGNGVFDGDDVFTSTWTAADGTYAFPALGEGPYRVSVKDSTLPAGLVLGTGADPTQLTLAAGENATVDFGYVSEE